MPRELITIQVGQCGNQIGCRFWDLALREHASHSKNGLFDDALSSFFRNVDTRYADPLDIPVGDGKSKIKTLKARAVLIDMEEGVLNSLLTGPLRDLFDSRQIIRDVSGSGNNWATGHEVYGPQYQEEIIDKVRKAAERCDSLQSFFLLHSLGGGTGSGLGSYILHLLEDNFPEVYRFSTAVFPSADDDVVTSPYNSVLALKELCDHADCVLPIDNQSLIDLVQKITGPNSSTSVALNNAAASSSTAPQIKSSIIHNSAGGGKAQEKPFDKMNNIAAHLLTNLTSSMRFEGTLNVDLNEITMNLVPYPRLHFLMSSLSPLYSLLDVKMAPRRMDQMFSDVFSKDFQLIRSDPKHNRYLACGFLVRGNNVQISDINRNISRIKPSLDLIYWNQEGFKVGLCSVPPVGQQYSLLCLANNCCIADTFQDMHNRFMKLYKRQFYSHHYTNVMDAALFDESSASLASIIHEYRELQRAQPPEDLHRFIPAL